MVSKNKYENILLKEKHGNVVDVLKFAGIWKKMSRKELNVFSEILKEREKFSEGRSIIE